MSSKLRNEYQQLNDDVESGPVAKYVNFSIAGSVIADPVIADPVIAGSVIAGPVRDTKAFKTDDIHASLIAKTYSLLSFQLLVTFLVVLPMYFHKKYVENHTLEFFWPSVIFMFVLLFAMFVTHKFIKLFVSLLFAGATGLMIGSALVRYDADILMQTVAITLGTTFFCSALVHYTNINLHHWKGILYCMLWIMILASFVFIFFPPNNLIHIVYSICGIILFIAYILYDTSELRHTFVYDNDQYIIMATGIYLDIINLFLYVLQLLGDNER
jgi:FtsH-binding integral membrane protein